MSVVSQGFLPALLFLFFLSAFLSVFHMLHLLHGLLGWYLPTLVGIIHHIPECCVIKAVWCPLSLAVLPWLAKHASRAKSPMDLFLLTSLTAKILSCGYQMKRVQPYFFKDQPI